MKYSSKNSCSKYGESYHLNIWRTKVILNLYAVVCCLYARNSLNNEDSNKLKKYKKLYQANASHKKVGVAVYIRYVDLRMRNISGDRDISQQKENQFIKKI